MNETHKVPTIKLSCHAQNRLSDLEAISVGLEKCQKSLNDYLDSKRNAFPRFFFISDDELLSILGSSDPECVQEHMIKVYSSVCDQLKMSRLMTKPTKWLVRPAKTQISLGIRPVWSESSCLHEESFGP